MNTSAAESEGGTGALRGRPAVLIADDEPMVLMITQQLLQDSGFRVFTAEDGEQAVAAFAENASQIGCVVLDVTMPRLNGEEAARRIRSSSPGVRILLASGIGGDELRERMGGVIDGCVQKPFRIDELCETLKSMMPPATEPGKNHA